MTEAKTNTEAKSEAAPVSSKALPTHDILDDAAIWTPEIEHLIQAIVEQMRLDQPGMLVSGPQRNGKSSACGYVAAILSDAVGYPVTTFTWTMPEEAANSNRVFIQERMLQSNCTAVGHRDLAVLKNRLITHMVERAAADAARRIAIFVDEAQFLRGSDYGALVFIFNELERRRVRPFFVLVGQPELNAVAEDWMTQDKQQMVGRFSTRRHEYEGIQLDDLEKVLAGFDDDGDGAESTAAYRTAPQAYDAGWRVEQLAPLMREAVRIVAKQHNVAEDVRLPMQYLRSCLLAMLYRIIQWGMRPESLQLADAIDCVRASNFANVVMYYVRMSKGGNGDSRGELRGAPAPEPRVKVPA